MISALDRRQFLRGAALAGGGAALSAWLPAWAQTISPGMRPTLPTVSGEDITLTIARQSMTIDGRKFRAIGLNGTVPAPLIRLREGQRVRRGQRLGMVGSSGNASAEAPHLHFAILQTTADAEWWEPANAVNPYPLLTGQ